MGQNKTFGKHTEGFGPFAALTDAEGPAEFTLWHMSNRLSATGLIGIIIYLLFIFTLVLGPIRKLTVPDF